MNALSNTKPARRGLWPQVFLLFMYLGCFMLFCTYAHSPAATLELPQTGQTMSYATGDDGHFRDGVAWPETRFILNTEEPDNSNSVTDILTGLVWIKDGSTPDLGSCTAGTKTWQEALDYVACLNIDVYLGHNDWRLPNLHEINSLINCGQGDGATWLNSFGFQNVQSDYYWSSSTSADNTNFAWYMSMGSGLLSPAEKTSPYYVWPVRAASGPPDNSLISIPLTGQTSSYALGDDGDIQSGVTWPSPRFTDNNDGTVTDSLTGLIWLKHADCFGLLQWPNALASAGGLADGACGLTDGSAAGDWRLPNRMELESIIDLSQSNPVMSPGHPFHNVQSADYWSSSTRANLTYTAWYVNMYYGSANFTNKTNSRRVWAVRGGSGLFGDAGISIDPSSVDFSSINPGSSSSAQSLTITNTGTNNLYISSITLTGADAAQFIMQNDTCSLMIIDPSGTCTIEVLFSPSISGAKNAVLSVPSNAPSGTSTVPLSGSGAHYTLTVDTSGTGSGIVSGGGTFNAGAQPEITAIADEGSTFEGWSGDCEGAASPLSVTIVSDMTCTATFTLSEYTITASAPDGHGSISCESPVAHGGESACSIIPDEGYYLSMLTEDGEAVQGYLLKSLEGLSYSFMNVTRNHANVIAVFSAGAEAGHVVDLRQTGQTSSYAADDDGALKVGVSWPSPRFKVISAAQDNRESIVDRLTGVVWKRDGSAPTIGPCTGGTTSWQGALDYISCLNTNSHLGHTDWRLPNVNELKSLINARYSSTAVWLNSSGGFGNPFLYVQPNSYWSSTTSIRDTDSAWSVSMAGAVDITLKADTDKYVWPVRTWDGSPDNAAISLAATGQIASYVPGDDGDLQSGVSWPSPRYADNSDGTVTDNLTGLVWLKDANCFGAKTWANALASSRSLADGACDLADGSASGDGRLPNREEFSSLIDLSRYGPALSSGHPFSNAQTDLYCSSSTDAGQIGSVWKVSLHDGRMSSSAKASANCFVWPVRGGSGLFGSPSLSPFPETKDFGSIDPGDSSGVETFTIENTGTNNLYINLVFLSGVNETEFVIANDNCTNKTVSPSGSCQFGVSFTPASRGIKSSRLLISSNVVSTPTILTLKGTSGDVTPPTGSLVINGGAAYTKSTSVTLTLSASDAGTVTQMCLSNTSSCTTWQAFAATKIWSLNTTNGTKTVYVRFRDEWGNSNTVPYSGSIVLDSVTPTNGTVTATPGNTQTTLSWTSFKDAVTGIAGYKVVYATGTFPTTCSVGTALYTGTGTSYTHTGLTNGTAYYYRVCATDIAGNTSTGARTSAIPQ